MCIAKALQHVEKITGIYQNPLEISESFIDFKAKSGAALKIPKNPEESTQIRQEKPKIW